MWIFYPPLEWRLGMVAFLLGHCRSLPLDSSQRVSKGASLGGVLCDALWEWETAERRK